MSEHRHQFGFLYAFLFTSKEPVRQAGRQTDRGTNKRHNALTGRCGVIAYLSKRPHNLTVAKHYQIKLV